MDNGTNLDLSIMSHSMVLMKCGGGDSTIIDILMDLEPHVTSKRPLSVQARQSTKACYSHSPKCVPHIIGSICIFVNRERILFRVSQSRFRLWSWLYSSFQNDTLNFDNLTLTDVSEHLTKFKLIIIPEFWNGFNEINCRVKFVCLMTFDLPFDC